MNRVWGAYPAVYRFFLHPADPSSLGLMRILTGLVLLYVHIAYIPDLRWFLGPDAWISQDTQNKIRRQQAVWTQSWGWEDQMTVIRFDSPVHRREAQFKFLMKLPEKASEREQQLSYLKRAYTPEKNSFVEGKYHFDSLMEYANRVNRVVDNTTLEQMKTNFLNADPKNPDRILTKYLLELPQEQRPAVWQSIIDLNMLLPPDPEERSYVLYWLGMTPKTDLMWYYLTSEELYLKGNLHAIPGMSDFSKFKKTQPNVALPNDLGERATLIEYYRSWASDPRQASYLGTPTFSVFMHLRDYPSIMTVHIAFLVIFLMFTLGIYTRTVSVLTWFASLCYIHRGQQFLFGQDTMQTLLVTYLMIGPSGAAFSIDALRKRYRAARALALGGDKAPAWAKHNLAGPQATWLANFVLRLIQIHYCFIYASAGVSKLKGQTWWNHTAGWMTMANPEFGLARFEYFERFLHFLADYRLLVLGIGAAITLFTLTLEIGWAFLIWTRLRPVFLVGSAMLHTGISILMGLSCFGLYMLILVLAYFPSRLIREKVGFSYYNGDKFTLEYNSRDRRSVRLASVLKMLDLSNQLTLADSPNNANTVALIDRRGMAIRGQDAITVALRELAFPKAMVFIPGKQQLINLFVGK